MSERDGSEGFQYLKHLKSLLLCFRYPSMLGFVVSQIRHEWKWRGVEWWHRY